MAALSSDDRGPMPGGLSWLRRRWTLIALILSLALNLGFAGGFVLHVMRAPPPLPSLTESLQMRPDQRKAWVDFRQGMRQRAREGGDSARHLIESLWQEMAKPDADMAKVSELIDALASERARIQRLNLAETARFMARLDPKQRAEFSRIAEQRQMDGFGRQPATK